MPTANGLGVKWIRVRPIFNSLVPSLQLSDLPMYIIKSPPLFSTQRLAVMSPLPMGMDPGEPLVLGDVQITLKFADSVGEVLTAGPVAPDVPLPFMYYI